MPGKPNRTQSDQLAKRLSALDALPGWPARNASGYLHYLLVDLADEAGNTLDLHQAMFAIRFDNMASAKSASVIEARAWLVLRTLSRSAMGRDILQAIYGERGPNAQQMIMLQAADTLDAQSGAAERAMAQWQHAGIVDPSNDASPAAVIARHRMNVGGSEVPLALTVWTAVERQMDGQAEHLSDAQRTALYAWNQGYRSNDLGSPLEGVNRALDTFEQKTVATAGAAPSAWRRQFGVSESPLNALPLPAGKSPENLAAQIKQALFDSLAAMQPGDSVELSSGYRLFAGVDAVAVVLSAVAGWSGTLAPVIDPQLKFAWDKFVRIRRSRDGAEIQIGDKRKLKGSMGVGFLAGPNLGLGKFFSARLGALIYAGGSAEKHRGGGITLRVSDAQWKDLTGSKHLLDHLFRTPGDAASASKPAALSALVQAQSESAGEPVSVSWTLHHESIRRRYALVEGGPSVAADPHGKVGVRAAAGVAAHVMGTRSQAYSMDQGGAVQALSVKTTGAWQVGADPYIGAGMGVTLLDGAAPVAAVPMWAKYHGISERAPGWLYRLLRPRSHASSLGGAIELMHRHGKLLPSSALEIDVNSFAQFKQLAQGERYLWTPTLAAQLEGKPRAEQEHAVAQARAEMTQFLQQVEDNPAQWNRLVARYALTDQARAEVQTDLSLLEQCTAHDTRTRQVIQARIGKRMESHTSWRLEEMSARSMTSSKKPRVLRLPIEFGARKRHDEQRVMHRIDAAGAWSRGELPAVDGPQSKPSRLQRFIRQFSKEGKTVPG